jgi:lysophospholipase L1-like esterase
MGADMEAINNGVLNKGNIYRIQRVMKKAMKGESVTVGFLGGSITQGCLASTPQESYAYLVYKWWRGKFPKAQLEYVNAGIGGTNSQFGVARAQEDLLSKKVDFTVVEFSVNDDNNDHFLETYEGLIRRLYFDESAPAVLIVNSVRYDNGQNAEDIHYRVAKHYGIPCVSMKPTLYAGVLDGTYTSRDISADDLHPNDRGHRLMADVINGFLDEVYTDIQDGNIYRSNLELVSRKEPLTPNAYEKSLRYQNGNSGEVIKSNNGFIPDTTPQNDIRDMFRKGWTAAKKGATISFKVEGCCIGVQYRKSVVQPTPVAEAVIDGDTLNPITLDGNFDETWGDCLCLETLAEHLPYGTHTVDITIKETHDNDKVAFYLTSLIVS